MSIGNLINYLVANGRQTIPEVGMGATICYCNDRSAGTIIKVDLSGKIGSLQVQEDFASRIDNNGLSDDQTYDYTRNPDGCITTFKLDTKRGIWRQVYRSPVSRRLVYSTNGNGLLIGKRDKFHDFSF